MKNNNWGGARQGSGRKKGIGLAFTIQKHCQSFIEEMLKDEAIKKKAIEQLEINHKEVEHYIYIIKGKEYYKIGYTTNYKKRIKQYKTHNPNVNTICLVKTPKAFELEGYYHDLYKDKNVDGEWFNLTEEEVISTMQKLYKESYGW